MPNRTKSSDSGAQASGARHRTHSPEPHFAATRTEIQRFGARRLLPVALSAEA
jgi:hypothetical protein